MPAARSVRRRRWLIAAIVGAIVVFWCVAAGSVLLGARRQAQAGIDVLRGVRDDLGATQLVRGTGLAPVERAHTDFVQAHGKAGSWLLTPFRILPVIGRQVRSVDALTGSAATVTAVGARTMRDAKAAVAVQPAGGPSRISLVERLGRIATTSGADLRGVDLGPDQALVAPLATARADFAGDLDRLRRALTDLNAAATGLVPTLRGSHYLVFAANNAEMRAGSGMFLSVGVLTFRDGSFSLSAMTPTGDLVLPPGAVPVTGDFAARWGWTHPNEEWRNLATTPRFDASAELAVRMWQWRNPGVSIDGVLAIDPVALKAILAATGPVVVDGQTITADNVEQEVFLTQYLGFSGDDQAQAARRERLGAIARAAVDGLDHGTWDTATLLEQLRNAARGRHVLAWSGDPTQERGWKGIGIDGELSDDSVLLALLNRGGNKLDQFIDISSRVELTPGASGTAVTIRSTVTNKTPAGLPRYVAGPFPGRDYPSGTYVGIYSIDVPGDARSISIDHGAPLVAAGPDGPARVVATDLSLGPGARRELVVRFTLPPGTRTMQFDPTARVPGVTWSDAAGSWTDGDTHVVTW